ncbi:hypothetical protein B7486_66200 [cyanobacterium TDX16]|nr:hypothetical protein B7486_66200 [cyanobacterium TDX16]
MEVHPEKNPVLNAIKRVIPSTNDFREHHFFVKEEHKGQIRRLMTPLFAVLIMIEITDVVFAIDSIPAILAVSRSEFIVFSSNAFAILGLRSLYFLLAGLADKFRYLNNGLAIILGYVGVKFMIVEFYHVPTYVSLAVIAVVLTVTILLSIRADKNDPQSAADAVDDPTDGPPAVVEADPDGVTSGADVVEAPQPDTSNDPV